MPNKNFGAKLNTILLIALIVLMVIALHLMLGDKEKYFGWEESKQESQSKTPEYYVELAKDPVAKTLLESFKHQSPYSYSKIDEVTFVADRETPVGINDPYYVDGFDSADTKDAFIVRVYYSVKPVNKTFNGGASDWIAGNG